MYKLILDKIISIVQKFRQTRSDTGWKINYKSENEVRYILRIFDILSKFSKLSVFILFLKLFRT